MFYSTKIFKDAGLKESAVYGSIAMALLNLLVTAVSVKFVDRLGRRLLMYTGMIGMALSMIGLFVSLLLTVVFLQVYLVF